MSEQYEDVKLDDQALSDLKLDMMYLGLTPEELYLSNYPDSKLSQICMFGTRNTWYQYSICFVNDDATLPHIKISTEDKTSFLKKGSEKQAEDALLGFSLAIRDKSGGYIHVSPEYGPILKAKQISCVNNGYTDSLSTYIVLVDNQYQPENLDRRLEKFKMYNPHAKHYNPIEESNHKEDKILSMLKIFSGSRETKEEVKNIPSPMYMTQQNVAGLTEYLQQYLGFRNLKIMQTAYKGVDFSDLFGSNLPTKKVLEYYHYKNHPQHIPYNKKLLPMNCNGNHGNI